MLWCDTCEALTLDPEHPDALEMSDEDEGGTTFATCEECQTTYAIF